MVGMFWVQCILQPHLEPPLSLFPKYARFPPLLRLKVFFVYMLPPSLECCEYILIFFFFVFFLVFAKAMMAEYAWRPQGGLSFTIALG